MSTRPPIDLRSDTVTLPSPAMREAMARAELGDDVFGEDPTVNRLERLAADLLDKEEAVFVASGTMGNLTAVLAHCGRGDEMILGAENHIFLYEAGGAAALGGVQPRTLANRPDGTLDLGAVEAAIRGDDPHQPVTRLIAVENTHNRCGGRVLPVAYMDAVSDLAYGHGLKLHVDGARLWNAAVALGVPPARLVAGADSVSVCLSKGLAAPVGSLVAGEAGTIRRVRRMRKMVGGGMRQAGVIAAAGIVALSEMIDRLAEDHANAKLLARGLTTLDGIAIVPEEVETNLVYFRLVRSGLTPSDFAAGLAARGVLLSPAGGDRLRAVTHYGISAGEIEEALAACGEALTENDGSR